VQLLRIGAALVVRQAWPSLAFPIHWPCSPATP
jgi:hypothetical protein